MLTEWAWEIPIWVLVIIFWASVGVKAARLTGKMQPRDLGKLATRVYLALLYSYWALVPTSLENRVALARIGLMLIALADIFL